MDSGRATKKIYGIGIIIISLVFFIGMLNRFSSLLFPLYILLVGTSGGVLLLTAARRVSVKGKNIKLGISGALIVAAYFLTFSRGSFAYFAVYTVPICIAGAYVFLVLGFTTSKANKQARDRTKGLQEQQSTQHNVNTLVDILAVFLEKMRAMSNQEGERMKRNIILGLVGAGILVLVFLVFSPGSYDVVAFMVALLIVGGIIFFTLRSAPKSEPEPEEISYQPQVPHYRSFQQAQPQRQSLKRTTSLRQTRPNNSIPYDDEEIQDDDIALSNEPEVVYTVNRSSSQLHKAPYQQAPVSIRCRACGTENEAENTRCRRCGRKLVVASAANTVPLKTASQQTSSLQVTPTKGVSLFGKDAKTGEWVEVSQKDRRRGLYVIGKNGTGKTTFLVNLMLQDIQDGLGLCFLDPHGDAIEDILKRMPAEREKDVILLDIMDTKYPFGLNLFVCADPFDPETMSATASFVMHVFEKVWHVGTETPLLAQVLRNVTITLIQNPGMTFAEIPLLLQDATARSKDAIPKGV